jgi:hypothetical protein
MGQDEGREDFFLRDTLLRERGRQQRSWERQHHIHEVIQAGQTHYLLHGGMRCYQHRRSSFPFCYQGRSEGTSFESRHSWERD